MGTAAFCCIFEVITNQNTMTKVGEIFIPVKGYKGYYKISNLGNIISLSKRIPCSSGKTRLLKERVLPNTIHIFGYVSRALSKDKVSKQCKMHRLVWISFNGKIPNGKEINHINGIKHDNRLCNLELATRKENIQHAIRTGLFNNRREYHTNSKLTTKQVIRIRKNKKAGHSLSKIGRQFKIHPGYASLIISGKRWGWLT